MTRRWLEDSENPGWFVPLGTRSVVRVGLTKCGDLVRKLADQAKVLSRRPERVNRETPNVPNLTDKRAHRDLLSEALSDLDSTLRQGDLDVADGEQPPDEASAPHRCCTDRCTEVVIEIHVRSVGAAVPA